MTTNEYLGQIKRLDKLIKYKLRDLAELRAMSTSVSAPIKEVNVQTSGDKDRLGNTIAKIVDLETQINAMIDKYIDKKALIVSQIEQIENPKYYEVLYLRYVGNATVECVASDLGYTPVHTRRLLKLAIIEFENKFCNAYK